MTYSAAIDYLNSLINYERQDGYDYGSSFKLERIRRVCAELGNPQDELNCVHVAGSKGKGSTSAMIQSILSCAGFRTGLYTSPHLVSFRERIRIGKDMISEDDISAAIGAVSEAAGRLGENPSFFEAITAASYLYFREKKTDFVVFETGLGGRLDATNIITPLVSVITPLSYEHTHILGRKLGDIAREKAGIIKEGSVCVSAPQEKEALDVIARSCREKNSKLILAGRDIISEELGSTDAKETFSIKGISGDYERLETGLLGPHQVVNAAVAVGSVEALVSRGVNISAGAIREGLKEVVWPGRLEVLGKNPYIVLDGAQNAASARALAVSVKKIFKYKRLVLVMGISKDKDIKGMLDELLPIAGSIVLTKSKIAERATETAVMRRLIGGRSSDITETAGVGDAVGLAISKASSDDMVLVTGSLFVVGEAGEYLKNSRGAVMAGKS
jgi:dihydrofolate synthase/folylpolyglutamate synthase